MNDNYEKTGRVSNSNSKTRQTMLGTDGNAVAIDFPEDMLSTGLIVESKFTGSRVYLTACEIDELYALKNKFARQKQQLVSKVHSIPEQAMYREDRFNRRQVRLTEEEWQDFVRYLYTEVYLPNRNPEAK